MLLQECAPKAAAVIDTCTTVPVLHVYIWHRCKGGMTLQQEDDDTYVSLQPDVTQSQLSGAQGLSTFGVILAMLLKDPKVTKPFSSAGSGATSGASAYNKTY